MSLVGTNVSVCEVTCPLYSSKMVDVGTLFVMFVPLRCQRIVETGFEVPAVQFNFTDLPSAMTDVCPDNVTCVGGTNKM